jgi:hypothetical protein
MGRKGKKNNESLFYNNIEASSGENDNAEKDITKEDGEEKRRKKLSLQHLPH